MEPITPTVGFYVFKFRIYDISFKAEILKSLAQIIEKYKTFDVNFMAKVPFLGY